MADNTTELEVLDQIVDVLGGTSGQHKTVVPVLENIRDLLSGGGGGGGGYNPSLSVGRADALTGADSTAQWATRESTGSGAATVRSVQGAAWVLNQRCRPQSFWTNNSTIETVDGVTTVTGTATSSLYFGMVPSPSPLKGFVPNHKYFVTADVDPSGITSSVFTGLIFNLGSYALTTLSGTNLLTQAGRLAAIVTSNSTFEYASLYLTAQFNAMTDTSGQYFTASNIQCFDLTQMFGAGREPSTAAEFQAMLLDDYYEYSTGTLTPVRIAGIASTDAQGNELDSVEWETQTLRAAGSVRDELTASELVTRVGVVDLGTLDWAAISSPEAHVFRASLTSIVYLPATDTSLPNAQIAGYTPKGWAPISSSDNKCFSLSNTTGDLRRVVIIDHDFSTTEAFSASVSGKLMFYALFNSTTTPISPALTMSYRVQAGGTESIIVPDGEISAIPVLTIAEGESAAELVMDALACIATPDGPVATSNHALNTYLTMGGKLYKVTSAIAVGETITAGTNVTATTVMDEILALN